MCRWVAGVYLRLCVGVMGLQQHSERKGKGGREGGGTQTSAAITAPTVHWAFACVYVARFGSICLRENTHHLWVLCQTPWPMRHAPQPSSSAAGG